ncbi:metallophosphoesterase [Sphingobium sufflavum]|uniref:metallophosphoesterase family protein n=1 Tax=Sphingobium sufflavum TaxID=1129547 RepID=UPI001F250AD6|nr:metallophosphoesterase [Sphingobium sufflavum]MCE7795675.1 metallophosphoesterase [Sphingobium sufflavum]
MVLILHASDLHFGAEDKSALDWFRTEAEARRPDAILITGDLTMRARRSEFSAARDWLASLAAPVSVEVGNHDLPYFDIATRLIAPYRRYRAVERFIERPLSLPDVAVVSLRTTARAQWRFNWSKGHVTDNRVEKAVALLAATPARHRLVTCHHPLVEGGTRGTARTRGGARALAALARAGASAILSGHVHDPFDTVVEADGHPIRLIGAGTLSERVRASWPSFNALTFDGPSLEVAVVTAV